MDINTCSECQAACYDCANNCCIGKKDHEECHKNCLMCAELCSLCIKFNGFKNELAEKIRKLCAEACEICALECEKFNEEKCVKCAQACRKCTKECKACCKA